MVLEYMAALAVTGLIFMAGFVFLGEHFRAEALVRKKR